VLRRYALRLHRERVHQPAKAEHDREVVGLPRTRRIAAKVCATINSESFMAARPSDHSFEEVRAVALDLLAGREKGTLPLTIYQHLKVGVGEVFVRREDPSVRLVGGNPNFTHLSDNDSELFLEVFWSLFREGIITLGLNDMNRDFPHFRVTEFGRRLIVHQQAYFFHDVSSYERAIRMEVPAIDDITVLYLKEAMQSFKTGCVLASTVMLGVATEHTFLLLLDTIERSQSHGPTFARVGRERTILQKFNKFKTILDGQVGNLSPEIKEDLDTHFAGILSIIRTFRNQAGHPTGKIIDREQAYVLMQLFIPYCKKMYQLRAYFS
jgi:hypothetical protein